MTLYILLGFVLLALLCLIPIFRKLILSILKSILRHLLRFFLSIFIILICTYYGLKMAGVDMSLTALKDYKNTAFHTAKETTSIAKELQKGTYIKEGKNYKVTMGMNDGNLDFDGKAKLKDKKAVNSLLGLANTGVKALGVAETTREVRKEGVNSNTLTHVTKSTLESTGKTLETIQQNPDKYFKSVSKDLENGDKVDTGLFELSKTNDYLRLKTKKN